MSQSYDDAVVGAGIIGLAHAYHLARMGRRVVVLERGLRAEGASIRNFGMLWPIGQPAGPCRRLALRSLEIWLEVLKQSGLWHEQAGSLHLAYHDDETQVLREFADSARATGFECALLPPRQVLERAPAVRPGGLRAGLWSPAETCVDPREVVAQLPAWLNAELGVHFEFGRAVLDFERPYVITSEGVWAADQLWVCTGDEFQSLYPMAFRSSGLVRCKLQMMRSQPFGGTLRLGPMLAGGLTLRHYKSFECCPSLAALKQRVARECPELDRYGIHVMASQNGRSELVIGDSHEYGAAIEPFDNRAIDDLILGYLETFLNAPGLQVVARWHGTYAKHPSEPYLVLHPAPGATAVTGVGGAGMTLSFGLAEQVVAAELGLGSTQ